MRKTIFALAVLCGIGLMAGCTKDKNDDNLLGKWEFVQFEYDNQSLVDRSIHDHGVSTAYECRGLEFRSDNTVTMEVYEPSDPGVGPDLYMPAVKGWSMSAGRDTLYIRSLAEVGAIRNNTWEVVELNETSLVYIERSQNDYHDNWTKYTYRRKK